MFGLDDMHISFTVMFFKLISLLMLTWSNELNSHKRLKTLKLFKSESKPTLKPQEPPQYCVMCQGK